MRTRTIKLKASFETHIAEAHARGDIITAKAWAAEAASAGVTLREPIFASTTLIYKPNHLGGYSLGTETVQDIRILLAHVNRRYKEFYYWVDGERKRARSDHPNKSCPDTPKGLAIRTEINRLRTIVGI